MKETINVNIAQQAFTMDMDAYRSLTAYLEDVSCRLPEGDSETYADIEARIAEIFRERVPSPMMVITLGVVEQTIRQIGAPETFGGVGRGSASSKVDAEAEDATKGKRKLYRSRSCRTIGGVCGGIADYLDADVSVVRLIAVLLLFFAGGSLWLYIILMIVLPEEPVHKIDLNKKGGRQ